MIHEIQQPEIRPSDYRDRLPSGRRVKRSGMVATLTAAGLMGAFAMGGALNGGPKEANGAGGGVPSASPSGEIKATPTPSASASIEVSIPSVAPSGTPEATPTTEPTKSPEVKLEDHPLAGGTHMEVFPGDLISGDVSMSDIEVDINNFEQVKANVHPMYDGDLHKRAEVTDVAKTALFVDVQAHGWVYAENGGFLKRGLTGQERQTTLTLWRVQKMNSGFVDANVVTWTGKDTTVDQAGLLASGQPGTVSSSENGTGGNTTVKINEALALLTLLQKSNLDLSNPENRSLVEALLKCICACENPNESPMPSISPTAKPEAVCTPWHDHIMKKGERLTFTADGFIAQGDDRISINGGPLKKRHDSDERGVTKAISRQWFGKPTTVTVYSHVGGTNLQVFDDKKRTDDDCATVEDWRTTLREDKSKDSRPEDRLELKDPKDES